MAIGNLESTPPREESSTVSMTTEESQNVHGLLSEFSDHNSSDGSQTLTAESLDVVVHLLHYASRGDVSAIESLLKKGVDINACDYDGRTALHLAASEGHVGVIKLLLSRGARVNPVDKWGCTPLADAQHYGHVTASRTLESAGGVTSLADLGNQFLSQKKSPFMNKDCELDPSELNFQDATPVGKGDLGEVLLARWRGTPVAIKTIQANISTPRQIEAEFRAELGVLQKLRHPNIVQFLGAVTESSPHMLVFEYCSGGTLKNIMDAKGPLPSKEAIKYGLDIARGMSYLHQHRPKAIVHRDLTPSNLLVDGGGHLKVADFGLSRFLKLEEGFLDPNSTVDKLATSSDLYMAPELAHRESFDKPVDVYSFGLILFEMFEGGAALQMLQLQGGGGKLEFRAGPYPPNIRELIQVCLETVPDQRPDFLTIVNQLELASTLLPAHDEIKKAASTNGHIASQQSGSGSGMMGCSCLVL